MKTLLYSLALACLPFIGLAQQPVNYITATSTISYYGASYGNDPTAEASEGALMTPPAVPAAITDDAEFKNKMEEAIADSKNNFADIKGKPYHAGQDTFTTVNCLPGADDCYVIIGSKKYYYASFGTFSSNLLASEKLDALKNKLLQNLGEIKWHHSLLDKTGYVEEYQVWSKTDPQNIQAYAPGFKKQVTNTSFTLL